nr:hypothetical protein [Tanacetum cinerariifolium]
MEEHVNTASADITDIGDSTAAPESVNAADEKVISTAGTMPVSTANIEDLSTVGSPKPSNPNEKCVTLREHTKTAKRHELPQIILEDKGKGKLEEYENPKKIKQLRLEQEVSDAELAAKFHAQELFYKSTHKRNGIL